MISDTKNCILCNSLKIFKVFDLKKTPIADNYFNSLKKSLSQKLFDLNLIICKKCNHVQLGKIIEPDILFKDYIYKSANSQSLLDHFKKTSEEIILQFSLSTNDLVVDIGSNDGSFLNYF